MSEIGEYPTHPLPAPDILSTIEAYRNRTIPLEQALDQMLTIGIPDPQQRQATELLIQQQELSGIQQAESVLRDYSRGAGYIIDAPRFIHEFCAPAPMTEALHWTTHLNKLMHDFKAILREKNPVVSVLQTVQYHQLTTARLEMLFTPSPDWLTEFQKPHGVFELTGLAEGFSQQGANLCTQAGLDGDRAWQAWQTICRFRSRLPTGAQAPGPATSLKYQVFNHLIQATLQANQPALLTAESHLNNLRARFPAHFSS